MPDLLSIYAESNRRRMLIAGFAIMALVALMDWKVRVDLGFGLLYLIPIVILAGFLRPWQILMVCLTSAILRETFGRQHFVSNPEAWHLGAAVGFAMAGLLVYELTQRRREELRHLQAMEQQIQLRQEAESQLRVLIETSPAAIITVDASGSVVLANEAAHRLLGFENEKLSGHPVGRYLPILANVPRLSSSSSFRTMFEERGRRLNGELFLAHVWFSTFETASGPQLAAIILDASEDLRERERLDMNWLMTSSRILVSAVSHEVRNLCWAIAVVYANLGRVPGLVENEDFKAMGVLVEGLERIAIAELRPAPEAFLPGANVQVTLDELRIVMEPSFLEAGMSILWDIPVELPTVQADQHGLLQVFLNLAGNSLRAMQKSQDKLLNVAARCEGERVLIRFRDTGPGVPNPDQLFKPFQSGAEVTGLGLYVSRALLRTFGGELRYEAPSQGSCFVVDLAVARTAEESYELKASTE